MIEDPVLPEYVGQWLLMIGSWLGLELRHYYPYVKRALTARLEVTAVRAENKVKEVKDDD